MIEVAGKLIGGPVYVAGENIGCCLTFTMKQSNENDNENEFLALCSAQIHCLCIIDSRYVLSPVASTTASSPVTSDTSFAPYKESDSSSFVVFSSKPKILFCNLTLSPGCSQSYFYAESLPNDIPPSYRGHLVKYYYKITVGMQRINSPIKLMRIPLSVLSMEGLPDATTCEESVDLSPTNPFLEREEKGSDLQKIAQVIQAMTGKRNAAYYSIANSRGKVARFCIYKHSYKFGEDIVGTLDFDNCTIKCVQFTASLQSEELIGESYRRSGSSSTAASSNAKFTSVHTHASNHHLCHCFSHCYFSLPIPLFVTPAFSTPIMSLRWKLHFEFATAIKSELENVEERAPQSLNIETMVWDLPVNIYPSTTVYPSADSQAQPKMVICF